jgi:hypothetical protein
MELQGDVGQMETHFVSMDIVLISMQDMCPICAERAIGLKIMADGTAR